jgi:hypothetical protein
MGRWLLLHADAFIQGFGEKQELGAVVTGDVGNTAILTQTAPPPYWGRFPPCSWIEGEPGSIQN